MSGYPGNRLCSAYLCTGDFGGSGLGNNPRGGVKEAGWGGEEIEL